MNRCQSILVAVFSLCLAPSLRADSLSQKVAAPGPMVSDEQPFDPDPLVIAGPGTDWPVTSASGLATDWAQRIDEQWGPSPWSTQTMLAIYDAFWSRIDQSFACFQGLDVDWTARRAADRAQIGGGVSLGRFVAIMNHAALALRESHTTVRYGVVNSSAMGRGVPLFVVGGWGNNQHFGAGLTPLADGSLLVYKVVPNHPLGLVPGDVVLGYDGIPWATLYPELLAAQLPLAGFWWGSSDSSWTHSMLMSAGLNWHLFDTIDIKKYETGETVHLPVDPLSVNGPPLFCTEQLPVPGVPMPEYLTTGDPVSWGVVSGTRIGYVYVQAWTGNAGTQFYEAVHTLLTQYETDGLIFDFRTNYGGNMGLAYPALELLFGDNVWTVGFASRCGADHRAMCPSPTGPPYAYVIWGTADPLVYDRPIAVLVGPGAVSSGDQVAHLFKFHPRARFFGESTSTAFNAPTTLPLFPGWSSRYAAFDAYRVSDDTDYLTHDELRVDVPVWLEPDDVAHGKDTVVDAAIRWINNRPPDVAAAHAAVATVMPPDHELQPVEIEGVIDPDGDRVALLATSITQDEPVDGMGSGNTCPDAAIVDGVAWVRRERDGTGDGRVYQVAFTARDTNGAESQGTVEVCVPHDRGRGLRTCVDSGQRYDATAACNGKALRSARLKRN